MKFAKYLESEIVSEWKTKYIHYKQLKRILKDVIDDLQESQEATEQQHLLGGAAKSPIVGQHVSSSSPLAGEPNNAFKGGAKRTSPPLYASSGSAVNSVSGTTVRRPQAPPLPHLRILHAEGPKASEVEQVYQNSEGPPPVASPRPVDAVPIAVHHTDGAQPLSSSAPGPTISPLHTLSNPKRQLPNQWRFPPGAEVHNAGEEKASPTVVPTAVHPGLPSTIFLDAGTTQHRATPVPLSTLLGTETASMNASTMGTPTQLSADDGVPGRTPLQRQFFEALDAEEQKISAFYAGLLSLFLSALC